MLPIEFYGLTRTQCAPVRVACNKTEQEITKERWIIITKLLNTEKLTKIAQQKCQLHGYQNKEITTYPWVCPRSFPATWRVKKCTFIACYIVKRPLSTSGSLIECSRLVVWLSFSACQRVVSTFNINLISLSVESLTVPISELCTQRERGRFVGTWLVKLIQGTIRENERKTCS